MLSISACPSYFIFHHLRKEGKIQDNKGWMTTNKNEVEYDNAPSLTQSNSVLVHKPKPNGI